MSGKIFPNPLADCMISISDFLMLLDANMPDKICLIEALFLNKKGDFSKNTDSSG